MYRICWAKKSDLIYNMDDDEARLDVADKIHVGKPFKATESYMDSMVGRLNSEYPSLKHWYQWVNQEDVQNG